MTSASDVGNGRDVIGSLGRVGYAAERLELPPVSSSVARARRFCRALLADWGASDLEETVSLLVSELVTNVVLHARTPCEVLVWPSDALRVEVLDHDPRPPVRKDHDPEAASGRGLLLLAGLSSRHGADHDETGKRIWFEVDWPAGWNGSVTSDNHQ